MRPRVEAIRCGSQKHPRCDGSGQAMSARLRALWLLLVGAVIGFALGRYTSEKPTVNSLGGVAVDCYDAQGKLVPDTWGEKFHAVTVSCAPGQTARVHQPPPAAPPAQDQKNAAAVPGIDYDALAKQHGAVDSTPPTTP